MKILVVRRDNIGDLVCTTPLFTLLRRRYPDAWIGALVNSYNAPILERNPDLDAVIAYDKLKHLAPGQSRLAAIGARVASFWKLRQARLDYVILATTDYVPRLVRLARWLAPRKVVGFADSEAHASTLSLAARIHEVGALHEVERVTALAKLLDANGPIPTLTVVPDPAQLAKARAAFKSHQGPKIAVHISARRPAQRWPAEKFAALISSLHQRRNARCMLLWSPGSADNARHPGDDDKARAILGEAPAEAAFGYATHRLPELVGALAACDAVVCSDGGASHISAALQRPLVCFFGDSPVTRWRPWKVPHRVLVADSRDVRDIPVRAVDDALGELLEHARSAEERSS
jgi:ADP-heptose:LPS heptosyltransferase